MIQAYLLKQAIDPVDLLGTVKRIEWLGTLHMREEELMVPAIPHLMIGSNSEVWTHQSDVPVANFQVSGPGCGMRKPPTINRNLSFL